MDHEDSLGNIISGDWRSEAGKYDISATVNKFTVWDCFREEGPKACFFPDYKYLEV